LKRSETLPGASPRLSVNVTVNLKFVAVVPDPGETPPAVREIVCPPPPHVLAATGPTNQTSEAAIHTASASAPPDVTRIPRLSRTFTTTL